LKKHSSLIKAVVNRKNFVGILFLSILLIFVCMLSLSIGAVSITTKEIVSILVSKLNISSSGEYSKQQEAVIWAIRMPRVILGILIGGGLAVSGAAMQGLFRNPLADPGLIGISSGAALAAVAVIVLGSHLQFFSKKEIASVILSLAAFGGGVGATFLVYQLSIVNGKIAVSTMLLSGIAVNSVCGAVTGIFTFIADDVQLRTLTFWSLGSLGGSNWSSLISAAPLILISTFFLIRFARPLNALVLGEDEAGHLGYHTDRLKQVIVLLVALSVGASVAVAGIIGFVGLVVPHLLRLTLGPDHRILLPASALLGSSLLLAADLIARTIVVPAELPIGIVTAMVGGPFFMYLLKRGRSRIAYG